MSRFSQSCQARTQRASAINGLVNNAQVKITDTGGRLIYETIALGRQAIWNGKGYNGQDAATGVYMVYSADDTGKKPL